MKIFKGYYDNPRDYDIRKVVVIAVDLEDAKRIIGSRLGLRKNAAGLSVYEVEYKEAKRVSKTKVELIRSTNYRPGLGHWDDSHYGDVKRSYCSQCNAEIRTTGDFCVECGSYFIN